MLDGTIRERSRAAKVEKDGLASASASARKRRGSNSKDAKEMLDSMMYVIDQE